MGQRNRLAMISCTPLITSLCALLLASIVVPARAAGEAPRPNVVLIMCDDMGFSDIGSYGGEVHTPNLDRLAAEGLRFTQFYNCAKCTTTRAALITGLHPRRGKGGLLRNNMVTIGEVVRQAGYQTALTGKWHLGRGDTHPFRRGFDEYYGLLDGCCNFFNPVQPDPEYKGGRVRVFGHNEKLITSFPDDFYTTDAFSDHAVETIHRYAKSDKPFFLHVCYTAPHYPLHAKPADIAKYKGKYMRGLLFNKSAVMGWIAGRGNGPETEKPSDSVSDGHVVNPDDTRAA